MNRRPMLLAHWKNLVTGLTAAGLVLLFPLWKWEAPLPHGNFCGNAAARMGMAPLWAPPVPGASIDFGAASFLIVVVALVTTVMISTHSRAVSQERRCHWAR